MKIMPTRFHGTMDYLMGVVLIFSPWLFGFVMLGAETYVPILIGAAVIVYSMFTDYERGIVRKMPMIYHLWLDGIAGLFLALSPWIFGFSELVWAPHVILGGLEFIAAITTRTVPETYRPEVHR